MTRKKLVSRLSATSDAVFLGREAAVAQENNILDELVTISADWSGKRLDSALAALSKHCLSRARAQLLIKSGNVMSGEKTSTAPDRKTKQDEEYRITFPPPERAEPEAQKLPLDIVYEDDDLLVINKPAGMVVHPAAGNKNKTLVNALLAHCGNTLSGIGGVARPGIVHRLDKDTSGLIVVAKNDASHVGLSRQFEGHKLSRVYKAFVWGTPASPSGKIVGAIGRHPKDRKKMAVVRKGGKSAITNYRLIKNYECGISLVECVLETGRTHQIRVHMAHIKNPVVGDAVYGKKGTFPRQALHAAELEFTHPITGNHMKFKCDLPNDMKALLKRLR